MCGELKIRDKEVCKQLKNTFVINIRVSKTSKYELELII